MKKQTSLVQQRGTAIIVALFVTALVAIAAVAMIEHLRIDTRRTELLLNHTQANLYAEGSIAWATDQLILDEQKKQPKKLVDRTPIHSPADKINGGIITSILYDAQGKFNLNNLTDPAFQTLFTQMLRVLAPNLSPENAKNIMLGIVDWISPGINNSQFDQSYGKLNPPYHAAHRAMTSVSELRLIKGITPQIYKQLSPYVTALPEKTKMNINSIPAAIIMAFSPKASPDAAKAFIVARQQTPIVDLATLANFAIIKDNPIGQGNLTTTSDYFMLRTDVAIGTQHLTLYTLLMRLLKNNKPSVMMVWQSKGTL